MAEGEDPRVGVVMGSASDWPTMRGAVEMLERFGVPASARSSRRTARPSGCASTPGPPRSAGSR